VLDSRDPGISVNIADLIRGPRTAWVVAMALILVVYRLNVRRAA